MSKERALKKKLKNLIETYLSLYTIKPALQTAEEDLIGQDKIASMIILLQHTTDYIIKQGLDFNKEYLEKLPKDEIEKMVEILNKFISTGGLFQEAKKIMKKGSSKKYLLPYLYRELNWAAISILCASYISANIIMRSVFELIIGIAAEKNGSMDERIKSISFVSVSEKTKLKKLWKELCGWAHPYGKWIKKVCPIYSSHLPIYHPKLFEDSLQILEKLVDLLLVVSIEKFDISKKDLLHNIKDKIDISNYVLFKSR
ncbi:hypothetical protein KY361_03085 [Candidatus Woesearchaeota archaeon]|nr:hypothetical protein [Candidatus Woesearchaeota archaeon]